MISERTQVFVGKTVGYTTWLYFGLSLAAVFVFLLASVRECGSIQFCTATIFFVVFIGSLQLTMLISPIVGRIREHIKTENIRFFFMEEPTLQKLAYIPLGAGLLLGLGYAAAGIDNQLAGIFISGLVLGSIFIMTNAILIPIVAHGIYNSFVVLYFEKSYLFNVPEVGLTIQGFTEIGSEVIFQNVLVAASEEMFRVFLIVLFIIIIKKRFSTLGAGKWLAMIGADAIWTIYHTIVSQPLT